MDDILVKKNRHLFLEEKDNQNNSFIGNINDVANRKTELDTVAAHITNVDTVGDHIDNVDTVANNISDINDAVDNIATVKTFNDNVNNGTMQYLLEAFTTSLNEQGNAWEVRLTQLGESILATTSAFNYSTVVTVSSDIPVNGTLILPNSMKYKVGTHMLMVSWNGTVCYAGEQYEEVGAYGVWATSIKLNQPAKAGDKIQFRIVALTDQSSYVDITEAAINASQFVASGSNTERYLPEFLGDVVNVKNFGAVGNGVNDDTTAFQSAIASGKAVFVPEGTYKLSTDLNGVFCGVGNSVFTGGTVNGSTVLRGIAYKNHDIINVKDFGAKGDGVTDDTNAFIDAITIASEKVFVPSGKYVVGSSVDINRCYGDGSLIYKTGREISLNGVMEADVHSQLFLQEINPSTNETFQDITIIGNKIFAARETANGVKISQYPLNFDVNTSYSVGTRAGSTAEAEYELAMISHGEGVHGFIDEEDQIWLYVPYTPDTGNKGFYKVKWSTTSTPTFTPYVLNELPNQAQIAVSHDGKYLVACRTTNMNLAGSVNIYGNQIHVYDRVEAETNQNALSIARFNIPKTGSITTRSGLDCDDRYIYLLTSTDQFGDDQNISVYDFSGALIKEWTVDGWIACFPNDVLNGSDGWYITAHEAEGLCLYKDMLVFYAKAYFYKPTSFCNLDGATFFATQASTGKNPITESSYWMRTATVESVADWDAETTYTAPTNLIHHKFICAIAPKGRYTKEYPIRMRLFNTDNSNLEGNDGVLITTTTNNDIILGRKNKRVNRVLPRAIFSDGSLAICATGTYDGVNENKRFASINKSEDGVFSIRGHGGAVAAGATFYMYPCAGYEETSTFYGAFRLWAGGTEAIRANNTALYSYRDTAPAFNNQKDLGTDANKWRNVYCQTGAFNGSDLRLKSGIEEPSDALMRAWSKTNFKVFKYIDAIEEKGNDKARLHVGVIAQEIVAAFESEGLDAMKYGFIAHNFYDDIYEDIEVVDEPEQFDELGRLINKEKTHIEKRLVSKAHDEYLIRYSEVLALECVYQRWLGKQRDAKIEALMQRISALENNQ